MEADDKNRACLNRAETRRRQVLEAAAECFRRHGFHTASMAQISKAARMSAGHIYNYFASKEEIIEAIVQQDIAEHLALMAEVEQGEEDILEALVAQVGSGVHRNLDRENSALMLEVLAEATRNPKVTAMVRQAYQTIHQRMRDLLLASRKGRQFQADGDLDDRVEILAALFNGLMVCSVVNPAIDPQAVTRLLRQTVQQILDPQQPPPPA